MSYSRNVSYFYKIWVITFTIYEDLHKPSYAHKNILIYFPRIYKKIPSWKPSFSEKKFTFFIINICICQKLMSVIKIIMKYFKR